MRHCRKYADFAHLFADQDYVNRRRAEIVARGGPSKGGCLLLPPAPDGYAKASFGGVPWQAHRLLWIMRHGDIGGMVVDHKCRNRACINLDHIEPVTNQENVQRGKDHIHGGRCPKGHELVPSGVRGWLACPICRREEKRLRWINDPTYRARNTELRRINRARAKAASTG